MDCIGMGEVYRLIFMDMWIIYRVDEREREREK